MDHTPEFFEALQVLLFFAPETVPAMAREPGAHVAGVSFTTCETLIVVPASPYACATSYRVT